MKSCGNCTLCCLLLPIPEVNSNPNELCSHCNDGCNIYETRPQSCRDFKCDWLLTPEMGEDLRPDRCNVIFEKIDNQSTLALTHFNHINSYKFQNVDNYIKKLNNNGISVIINSFTNEPIKFRLADGKTQKEIYENAIKELNK